MISALLKKAAPILNKALPMGVAANELSKADPRLKRFLVSAVTAGYGVDQAMNQLREMVTSLDQEGREAQQQARVAKGTALPFEKADVAQRESEAKAGTMLKRGVQLAAGAAAAGAPGLISEAVGMAMPEGQAQPDQRNYFQRAMEGVSFFDLDDNIKSKVGSLKQRLDAFEQQGVPFEDRTVQNVVNAMRKIVGKQGIVEQESERFEMGQQGGNADDRAIEILSAIAQQFGI